MPLPSQTYEIEAQIQHADGFVASGQTGLALGMYRTAALLAEQRGDLPRALAIHARIARLDPAPSSRARIGELQLALGQRAEAAATLDAVVRDELRAGRWPQALHAATTAVAAMPTSERRLRLADVAQRLGQVDAAVEQLHSCAADELLAGRVPRAQALCQRALGLHPGHRPTLFVAIDAHLRARDVHRAVAAIRTVLAEHPDDARALEAMAEAFAILGKRHNAAEVVALLAARLHQAGPDHHDAARALVCRGLGWDRDHPSLRALERALDEQPAPADRDIGADATRVVDLADLVEMRPVVAPAVPIRRTAPPAPAPSAPAPPGPRRRANGAPPPVPMRGVAR